MEVYFDDFRVEHVKGPVVSSQDYYPFGLTFNSYKREKGLSNQVKFNGIEEQDELGLNVYQAFYRISDPAIARWWQLDPKPSAQESSYTLLDNNPILRPDPLGDIVGFARGEGVTRKEHRQFKREIRRERQNSESFRKMYNDLDASGVKYVYKSKAEAINASYGKTDYNDDGSVTMNVVVRRSAVNGQKDVVSTIAHETAHGWRSEKKLDPAFPKMDAFGGLDGLSKFNKAFADYHKASEVGASHLENVVRSELERSGKGRYKGIGLSETYTPSMIAVPYLDNNSNWQLKLGFGSGYNLLEPPRDANYYKNKIDITKDN